MVTEDYSCNEMLRVSLFKAQLMYLKKKHL